MDNGNSDLIRERIESKLMVVSQLINTFVKEFLENTDVRLISAEVMREKQNDSPMMVIAADEIIDGIFYLLSQIPEKVI